MLHCRAYRRLKHKTQVFFATRNDRICARIEHVNHVASVSYTISKCLRLNTELTNAIALGHDLGHPPFGHEGESILSSIALNELGDNFRQLNINKLHKLGTCVLPESNIG
ncbi:HD domain-containing protein [Gelria sp. Kuro-4]|uniref:HD domain-containing protein n=1 Tax=Gelria sp. Kuro-4 TaxID=2796927 RepID=UPI001C7EC8E8